MPPSITTSSPSSLLLHLLPVRPTPCNQNPYHTMPRRLFIFLLHFFFCIFFYASFSIYTSYYHIYSSVSYRSSNITIRTEFVASSPSHSITDNKLGLDRDRMSDRDQIFTVDPNFSSKEISSVAVLLPDWEVLLIISSETSSFVSSGDGYLCLYPNKRTSPARFSGVLPFTNRMTFKCILPQDNRRRQPFLSPILVRQSEERESVPQPPVVDIIKWTFVVYDTYSTENDVIVFVKGLNNRQGINKSPEEFKCVFIEESTNGTNAVRTSVTSSTQEVFRCLHPDLMAFVYHNGNNNNGVKLKVSIEVVQENAIIPSVAYYMPRPMLAKPPQKFNLCASTMVFNVTKFLREWVIYNAKIGVEKFILYDNNSEDDLKVIIEELNKEGYIVETLFWIWPKTQEAGFSHAALHSNSSCKWMMYADIDEFVYAPSWVNDTQCINKNSTIQSLLPWKHYDADVGQVRIPCYEFGPSNLKKHPVEGVTQGYDCRRRFENRHKSIVLLDAISYSLLNVIHHFTLKNRYRSKNLKLETAVINHYKYQAWDEFKIKFRRRVSAYVVDWMKAVNPASKDRAPGLGFDPIEPPDWEQKFCEVKDDQLKLLTQRWFGSQTLQGYKLAWQR